MTPDEQLLESLRASVEHHDPDARVSLAAPVEEGGLRLRLLVLRGDGGVSIVQASVDLEEGPGGEVLVQEIHLDPEDLPWLREALQ